MAGDIPASLAGAAGPAKRKTSSCDMVPAGFAVGMPARRHQSTAPARQSAGRRASGPARRKSGSQAERSCVEAATTAAVARLRSLARAGEYASPACSMPEIED